jgi:tRNA nucleotidyltransferase (CCA-adding enzyme)
MSKEIEGKEPKLEKYSVPKEVSRVTKALRKAGFEAYLVGGCVRDLIRGKKPKDWDVTTNALPEEIERLFDHTFYENDYGTVGVVDESVRDKTLEVVEVTTYRLDATYSDNRHPDTVSFSKHLGDDLKRRDFTINAIAYDEAKENIVDPFKGQNDLKSRVISAVGDPDERFKEDALRIMRAIRLATELGFTISRETGEAIRRDAKTLTNIAKERIRDELIYILNSKKPMDGLMLAQKLGVLPYLLPDLERGIGVEQNQAHAYDVWEHNLRSLQHAADKSWPLEIRLAALLHDIGKPRSRRRSVEKNDWTFHGHDVLGARMAKNALEELKFPKKTVKKIVDLVRWHMFFSDTEKITLSAVRRMVSNVGEENIWDLMDLRICDRIGTGRPKENPYRFRKYKAMVEEVLRDPTSVGMLKVNGSVLMEELSLVPGPAVGHILHALLEDVLNDPSKNTKKYLLDRARELSRLSLVDLKKIGDKGRAKREEVEESEVATIRKRYWVS